MLAVGTVTTGTVACGGDDDGPGCTSAASCPAGQGCFDGRCVASPDSGRDAGPDAATDATAPADAGPRCGSECEGVCTGEVCCAVERACGEACCAGAEICSFARCVVPGDECRSDDDCDAADYCETGLGETVEGCGGVRVPTGRCLPRPPRCPSGVRPDPRRPECVEACSFAPVADAFDVVRTYSFGSYDGNPLPPNRDDVRNAPIVIQMDDDDCDGRVTGRDIPEVVFAVSPDDQNRPDGTNPIGDLVVAAVIDGELRERWRAVGVTNPWSLLAGADLDGRPGSEIVGCNVARNRLLAFRLDEAGSALETYWMSPVLPLVCTMPAIADVDRDGVPEVLVGGTVLHGRTGEVRYAMATPDLHVIAIDVDADPEHRLELVSGRRVHRLVGERFEVVADLGRGGTYPLVADLEPGGRPEIVSVDASAHRLHVWRLGAGDTLEVLRADLDINGPLDPTRCAEGTNGRTGGGGPPTAADVNADGIPDIAVAGGVGYAVLDGARLVDATVADAAIFLWARATVDCSSAITGSSVFDFNGDGRAEVLYADEHDFQIYDGRTGATLFETCSTNGTILELPIVADIDGDGQADVLVAANARYRACLADATRRVSGIQVFGSAGGRWVRTRSVWNQHAYHITNIEESGVVPPETTPNWATPGLNNFRQNRQPGNELSAVDAVVALAPGCSEDLMLVTVRNLGEAVLPAGAEVVVYRGAPADPPRAEDELARASTTRRLYPAQAETLRVHVGDVELANGNGASFAVVRAPDGVPECRTDNNVASELASICLL